MHMGCAHARKTHVRVRDASSGMADRSTAVTVFGVPQVALHAVNDLVATLVTSTGLDLFSFSAPLLLGRPTLAGARSDHALIDMHTRNTWCLQRCSHIWQFPNGSVLALFPIRCPGMLEQRNVLCQSEV